MQQPLLIINWLAIIVSMVVAFSFGFVWFGPLFGRQWAKELGLDFSRKPDPKVMQKAFALQVIGLFLTTFVLAHSNQVWRPSVWGFGQDGPSWMYGFYGAMSAWLGFFVPLQLSKVQWESRSWRLFSIHAGYDFLHLMIISQILANWR